ncbi:MAG TPA: protein kinase [Vicinamibacteria bacterium]|nr:protein kinase [Vicinamibacteria bacterium]
MAAAGSTLSRGSRLGPYEIIEPLGAGGMGEVYRARHSRLGREVAIKVMAPRLADDPHALGRFEREARAVAALSHPHILAIHDFGEHEGTSFAVMELLEGETLRARLARGPLPWRKAAETAAAVADGLAAAHGKGIVHRDLKPDNIFLTSDGGVKVLGFGLARTRLPPSGDAIEDTPTATHTEAGTVMGTPGYISPEQLRGREADARSDIFALGVVLYEMLTGRRAFLRGSPAETVAAILGDDPPPLAAVSGVPLELERLARHCLEKNPEERFQSARDLAFQLRALLADSGAARRARAGRGPSAAVTVAAFAALAIAVAAAAWFRHRSRPDLESLAVLPFTEAGGDPNTEYLSDGLTETLINNFSQVEGLKVAPRTTVFRYKGRDADPLRVGRDLGVRTVLTGRVVQRGDTLSVQADLIDVDEGTQLWGERYDRRLAELQEVQQDISRKISDKLRLRLTRGARERLERRETTDTEAYRLYLLGRFHWNKRTREALERAVALFQEAIDRDPRFALAHAALADCYLIQANLGYAVPAEAFPKCKAAALRAIEIDDSLAEAHTPLAFALGRYDLDWEASEREFKRAIELNPRYPISHQYYAFTVLAPQGRLEEGFAEIKRARELDPLSLPINGYVGAFEYYLGHYDRAIAEAKRTLELDPRYFQAHRLLGQAYVKRGMAREGIAELQAAAALAPDSSVILGALAWGYATVGRTNEARAELRRIQQNSAYAVPFWIAATHAALGEKDEAFRWLKRSCEERDTLAVLARADPALESLRSDPRFTDVLRCLGLAP